MQTIYSPILSGPAGTGVGHQAAKSDWQAIALAVVVIGIVLPALLVTGLWLGERRLETTAIYTA